MNAATTLARWALPRTAPERRRWVLTVVAVALWAALMLIVSRLIRLGGAWWLELGGYDDSEEYAVALGGYGNLVRDVNIRVGLIFGALLTSIAPLALLGQAVRIGSTERQRLYAALRVAGAGPGHLRLLAWFQSAGAALAGAVVGVAVMVGLADLTPHLPRELRVVPAVDVWTSIDVVAVALIATLMAGAAGRWTVRDSRVDSARSATPEPSALPRGRAVTSLALLAAEIVGGCMLWAGATDQVVVPFALIAGFIVVVFTAAPYTAVAVAAGLERRGDPIRALAAARLRSDPRTPGRAATVLLTAAVALTAGVISVAVSISEGLENADRWGTSFAETDAMFYIAGGGLTVLAAVVAVLTAGMAMLAGASEQLLTGRRAFAVLSAFGVGERQLQAMVRVQTTSVASAAGVLGCLMVAVPCLVVQPAPWMWALLAGATLLVWLMTRLSGLVVVAVLRPQIRAAAQAGALRTA